MEHLGGSAIIEKLQLLDADAQVFGKAGYDEAGGFYGTNPLLPPPDGSLSLIIHAKDETSIHFTSMFCSTWHLQPGVNLAGTACPSPVLTAHEVLRMIADLGAPAAIQVFDRKTGRFSTAVYGEDGTIFGQDFPILPAQAYLLHLRDEVVEFQP